MLLSHTIPYTPNDWTTGQTHHSAFKCPSKIWFKSGVSWLGPVASTNFWARSLYRARVLSSVVHEHVLWTRCCCSFLHLLIASIKLTTDVHGDHGEWSVWRILRYNMKYHEITWNNIYLNIFVPWISIQNKFWHNSLRIHAHTIKHRQTPYISISFQFPICLSIHPLHKHLLVPFTFHSVDISSGSTICWGKKVPVSLDWGWSTGLRRGLNVAYALDNW